MRSRPRRIFEAACHSSADIGTQTWSRPLRLVKPWWATLWPTSQSENGVSDGRNAMRPTILLSQSYLV